MVTHNVSQSPSLPKYMVLYIKFWHFIAAYQLYLHKCINNLKQLMVLLWFAGRIRYLSRDVRKPGFRIYAKTKTLISAFVFATWLVQYLYFLNTKFPASSHLQWLYSPVCVRPGRKPRRPVFSQQGSLITLSEALDSLHGRI